MVLAHPTARQTGRAGDVKTKKFKTFFQMFDSDETRLIMTEFAEHFAPCNGILPSPPQVFVGLWPSLSHPVEQTSSEALG